jgi:hypothetical protein
MRVEGEILRVGNSSVWRTVRKREHKFPKAVQRNIIREQRELIEDLKTENGVLLATLRACCAHGDP